MTSGEKLPDPGKKGQVYVTFVSGGEIIKKSLDREAAEAAGYLDGQGWDLLADAGNKVQRRRVKRGTTCPSCGLAQSDFEKTGRFGCASCYEAFRPLLIPVLRNMHVEVQHVGKFPQRTMARQVLLARQERLESRMQAAIKEEAYEAAAALRDQMAALRAMLAQAERKQATDEDKTD